MKRGVPMFARSNSLATRSETPSTDLYADMLLTVLAQRPSASYPEIVAEVSRFYDAMLEINYVGLVGIQQITQYNKQTEAMRLALAGLDKGAQDLGEWYVEHDRLAQAEMVRRAVAQKREEILKGLSQPGPQPVLIEATPPTQEKKKDDEVPMPVRGLIAGVVLLAVFFFVFRVMWVPPQITEGTFVLGLAMLACGVIGAIVFVVDGEW
jgi:hypothetical protein